jgi:hypothetical protein
VDGIDAIQEHQVDHRRVDQVPAKARHEDTHIRLMLKPARARPEVGSREVTLYQLKLVPHNMLTARSLIIIIIIITHAA